MRILIVEDDDLSRKLLSKALNSLGHEIIESTNGYEALAEFHVNDVQLIVSDWMMPILDGLELCRKIRSRLLSQYVYLILLTAKEGKNNFLEGMDAGADDFISKPLDIDTLKARLHVAERILSLQKEVKQLEGLLPICSYCKRIKNDEGEWEHVEDFIASRTEASFSHSFCPVCYEVHLLPQIERIKNL